MAKLKCKISGYGRTGKFDSASLQEPNDLCGCEIALRNEFEVLEDLLAEEIIVDNNCKRIKSFGALGGWLQEPPVESVDPNKYSG